MWTGKYATGCIVLLSLGSDHCKMCILEVVVVVVRGGDICYSQGVRVWNEFVIGFLGAVVNVGYYM